MTDESKGKRMITVKLDADVHMMLKILAKRYKAQGRVEKGKISISDAARFFVEEHDSKIAKAAVDMTDTQNDLANMDTDSD